MEKSADTKLAKAIRTLQNEVDEKMTLLETLRDNYDAEDIDYYAYLKTQAWEDMRQKIFRRDGFKCVICHEAKNLNVHHITYENLGAEKESDLVTLCQACHEKVHSGDPMENLISSREKNFEKRANELEYNEMTLADRQNQYRKELVKQEMDEYMDSSMQALIALVVALGEAYFSLDARLKIQSAYLPPRISLYGFINHINLGKTADSYEWSYYNRPPISFSDLPKIHSYCIHDNTQENILTYLFYLGTVCLPRVEHFMELEKDKSNYKKLEAYRDFYFVCKSDIGNRPLVDHRYTNKDIPDISNLPFPEKPFDVDLYLNKL